MLQMKAKVNARKTTIRPSKKEYSISYQEKLDNAVSDAKKSKTTQSVKSFLKEVRLW